MKLEQLRKITNMGEDKFNEQILLWAKKFNITIDGEYANFAASDVDEFIVALARVIRAWKSKRRMIVAMLGCVVWFSGFFIFSYSNLAGTLAWVGGIILFIGFSYLCGMTH